MMCRRLCSLLVPAMVVLGVVVLTAATASAQSPPPRTCTIQIGSSNTIQVDALSNTSVFPEALTSCPAGSGFSAECLKWRYQFTRIYGESSIALGVATADADIPGVTASAGDPESFANAQVFAPGVGDSSLGTFAKNVFDIRAVKFAQSGSSIIGTIYTPVNVRSGNNSVGVKVGNIFGFCPIAGPSDVLLPTVTGKAAVTTMIVDQAGQCTIVRTVDAAGCTTNVESTTEGCVITLETPVLVGKEGEPFAGGSCSTQVTFGTGTRYCYTSTFGKLVCVTSP